MLSHSTVRTWPLRIETARSIAFLPIKTPQQLTCEVNERWLLETPRPAQARFPSICERRKSKPLVEWTRIQRVNRISGLSLRIPLSAGQIRPL
jgi:hypothetical protein